MRNDKRRTHGNTSTPRFIIVTGGVLSGLGKGIVSASIGRLKSVGLKVVPVKCDGYLNIDPGTMNPYEHGEVFVMDDGGEVDMDFGHYERFMNINTKFDWNLTSGKIFKTVIEKERRGDYLGKTVQMIPHVTDEIKRRLFSIAREEKADIVLVEIGGTVGDIELMLFLEAVRQLKADVRAENIMYVHLTLVPSLETVGEQKTKPTQVSVKALQAAGIQPDVIIGRSEQMLSQNTKKKIALFCNIPEVAVISDPDVETVYELPLVFEKEGLSRLIYNKFGLQKKPDLEKWKGLVANIKKPRREITVAMAGKYTGLHDSYVSINEALVHAGAHQGVGVKTAWIETTGRGGDKELDSELERVDGVIVPGGFGSRGAEGKIRVIRFARENSVPFLGLCYGLQLAVVEYARNACGLKNAGSTEIRDETQHPVVDILPEQKNVEGKGGTMRLGTCPAVLKKGSLVRRLYGRGVASERHRHRYEVSPSYHDILQQNGLVFSGMSPDRRLAEFIELKNHPFFVATQAHPELKSRLERPSPVFMGFVAACVKHCRTLRRG